MDYFAEIERFIKLLPDPSKPRMTVVRMTTAFMESLKCSVYYRGTPEYGHFKLGHQDWRGVPIQIDDELEVSWIILDQFNNEMKRAEQ